MAQIFAGILANVAQVHFSIHMMLEMKKQAGITERLKAENPIVWVGHMNALKQQAEETILAELIYT